MNSEKEELLQMIGRFNPKTEIGRDGALRRHRAVQARNTLCEIERGSSIRSARCTRAGTAQRAFPTSKPGGTT
jgi:hypothetical protein